MGEDGTQPRITAQDRTASDRPGNDRLANDRLANDRLDSWKEIAAYLNKEVRTVQRWEKSLGLPVRRLAQGKQGTVFAYKLDLDAWWQESQTKLEYDDDQPDPGTISRSNASALSVAGANVAGQDVHASLVSSSVVPGSSVSSASIVPPNGAQSNVVVLPSAGGRPEKDRQGKTTTIDHRPDLIRRLTVLCLLIIVAAGVASVAGRFWLQTPGASPEPRWCWRSGHSEISAILGRTLSPTDSPRK